MPQKKMAEVAEGIYLEPVPVTLGDEIRIKYKGALSKTGSGKIYLHAGFGYGEWSNVQTIPMRKTRDGAWSARIKVIDDSRLNFCFRDDANNWDNNTGRNWSYEIHNGSLTGFSERL